MSRCVESRVKLLLIRGCIRIHLGLNLLLWLICWAGICEIGLWCRIILVNGYIRQLVRIVWHGAWIFLDFGLRRCFSILILCFPCDLLCLATYFKIGLIEQTPNCFGTHVAFFL